MKPTAIEPQVAGQALQAAKRLWVGLFLVASGCWSASPSEVVVYTALDREFSEPIFRDFEQANRPALEAGGFDPAHLHYPQEMLFK